MKCSISALIKLVSHIWELTFSTITVCVCLRVCMCACVHVWCVCMCVGMIGECKVRRGEECKTVWLKLGISGYANL